MFTVTEAIVCVCVCMRARVCINGGVLFLGRAATHRTQLLSSLQREITFNNF